MRDSTWKVLLYKNPRGDTPVNDFILSLELKAQAKVFNSIKLIQSFGTSIGPPRIKKLSGTRLWELRILGADSIRVLYITIFAKTFLLLHGFKKKTNKTPAKEIRVAIGRLFEFESRK